MEVVICINHSVPLSFYFGRKGSFSSSEMCGFYSVSLSTSGGGGRGAHLLVSVSPSMRRWGRGSFASSTLCLPLPWWEMGTGLICIIHNVTPFGWSGRGSFASSIVCLLIGKNSNFIFTGKCSCNRECNIETSIIKCKG